ncbi:MAG: serine/threonine protein kinase [Bradymonadia bacterium]|jgi:serine/threonine protein kinase
MHDCSTCGHAIQGSPNFCPACGASLTYTHIAEDPLIGRIIGGSFEVDALIGEGAMGRVYSANQIQLRKKVALKILRSNLVGDTTVVKRFEREAQAASRLDHPNCISIYGFGQEDDGELLWMAMEYIDGRDLGSIIATDAPMPVERLVHIFSQVCEALDEAHSANIIHRDLKPANIVCFDHRRSDDFVKVLDFGIAKITDPGEDYQPLTRDGIVCGTPAYMSPEQVQGFELDPRSDLFSLGIILYQAITGKLPFFAESAVEVATKIVIDQPQTPSSIRPEWSYPAELEAIALKLLSKNKEDRYPDAIAVNDALKACLETLRERSDASLDIAPDQLAELMIGIDDHVKGAATMQFSQDEVRDAMQAQRNQTMPSAQSGPVIELTERKASRRPHANASTVERTDRAFRPTSARRDQPPMRSNTGFVLGLILVLVAVGAGAWVLFGQ